MKQTSVPIRVDRPLWLKGSKLIMKSIGKPIKLSHSKIYEAGLLSFNSRIECPKHLRVPE